VEGDRRHRGVRLGRPPRRHPRSGRTRRHGAPGPGGVGAAVGVLRWEHACTEANLEAGEDIRWLPRTEAADLLLPGADCWVFDHRVVRWNFQRGDGTNPRHYTFSSDPRTIRDIIAAFEIAWQRAIPHPEYKTG
jgi:hypothetical protein